MHLQGSTGFPWLWMIKFNRLLILEFLPVDFLEVLSIVG